MDIMRGERYAPLSPGRGRRITVWPCDSRAQTVSRYLDTVDTVDIVPNRFCPPSAGRPRAPRRADPIMPRPGTEAAALGPAAVSLMGDTAHRAQ